VHLKIGLIFNAFCAPCDLQHQEPRKRQKSVIAVDAVSLSTLQYQGDLQHPMVPIPWHDR
jgi:hypothetical protein